VVDAYNVDTNKNYRSAMIITSYAFLIQFMICTLFTIVACARFGEQEMTVRIKQHNNTFLCLTGKAETKDSKAGKKAQKERAKRTTNVQ
jgi:hypothetical protein